MKARKDEWLLCVLFFAFLGIMAVLFMLLPKEEFSETEKRFLSSAPEFSLESLASGEFGSEIETYMADYIPGRDFFVGVNSYFERLTLRQVTETVYVAEGSRLVEDPVQWERERIENNVRFVNEFSELLDQPVDFLLVPSGGWAVQDRIIGIADPYYDDEYIARIYAMTGDSVLDRDVLNVVREAEDPGALYYRTDHHWTSLGAYKTYQTYMEMLGKDYRAADDFTVETVSGFKGTTYSGSALWLTPGEDIELWTGSEDLTVTTYSYDAITDTLVPAVQQSLFYREHLESADMYSVFLDGILPLVRIDNPNANNDETLLVVRDSYSSCLGGFLAESYKTVILVDLRYYMDSTLQLCREEAVDRVLICYSLGNFSEDMYMGKLLNEPVYTVTVVDEAGEAVQGALLEMKNGSEVYSERTDGLGVAQWYLYEAPYVLRVTELPEGYQYAETVEYEMDGIFEMTVIVSKSD